MSLKPPKWPQYFPKPLKWQKNKKTKKQKKKQKPKTSKMIKIPQKSIKWPKISKMTKIPLNLKIIKLILKLLK